MDLIDKRIQFKLKKNEGEEFSQKGVQSEIIQMKRDLGKVAEMSIVTRLQTIQRHVRHGQDNPDISMSELFHDKPLQREQPTDSFRNIFKKKQIRDLWPPAISGRFFKRDRD